MRQGTYISAYGTFGLQYRNPEDGYVTPSVDWSRGKGQWVSMEREGVRCYNGNASPEKMRMVLLERFGLAGWADELPWEHVHRMSPRDLISIRRSKERKHGLTPLEVRSDTVGYKIFADDFR